jgi:hypothetical protein
MTESKTIKNPSALVLAVLTLDEHFNDLKRLSERIEEMDLKSNSDFEQSEKLINHFAETGQAISTDIASFVSILSESRAVAELAAQKVMAKSELLKLRKDDIQNKLSRFEVLSQKVTHLNESLLQFKPADRKALSELEKVELKSRLSEINAQLNYLIEEAQVLKDVGHESKIKTLEQNADSMRQTLIAAGKKISAVLEAH